MLVKNPGLGAGLIRLHFHDCFGCDASILIDGNEGNVTEKDNFINKSLRGCEIIYEAKLLLEEECLMTVSCTDIIAFAARDAANILGGIKYKVPGGRRDGVVSEFNEVFSLPNPTSNLSTLKEQFQNKGLTVKDLVVLSGAHSLGRSQCTSFTDRIYNFSQTHRADPVMDPDFLDGLRDICPNTDNNITVPMDFASPNRLDNAYYRDIRQRHVLFTSDQTLMDSKNTKDMVNHYAAHGGAWKKHFAKSMVRMGSIEVMHGDEGQIRSNCRLVNQ
ncbi:hypothetical protein vseg_021066 [Gypsophila vaccaria]